MYHMNNNKAKEQIEKRKNRAQQILGDKKESRKFIKNLESKYQDKVKSKNPFFFGSKIKQLQEYIPLLISLIKSYINKEYTEIPYTTILSIVGALIYFFSPVDLIPDFILGLGYIDDAGVIMFCVGSIMSDLEKYRNWKTARDNIIDVEVDNDNQ